MITRFQDVVLSFYLFNEYRGFIQLDRLVEALRKLRPSEVEFIQGVAKHAADERKHYFLFCQYFRHEGRMPFHVGKETGYFDILARSIVGSSTDLLTEDQLANNTELFSRLCRAIVTTEKRGIKQIDSLMRNPIFSRNEHLMQIFGVIRRDEPSHFKPYEKWLQERKAAMPGSKEMFWEILWHYAIGLFVFPFYLLNPLAKRRTEFPFTPVESLQSSINN